MFFLRSRQRLCRRQSISTLNIFLRTLACLVRALKQLRHFPLKASISRLKDPPSIGNPEWFPGWRLTPKASFTKCSAARAVITSWFSTRRQGPSLVGYFRTQRTSVYYGWLRQRSRTGIHSRWQAGEAVGQARQWSRVVPSAACHPDRRGGHDLCGRPGKRSN